MDTPNIRRCAFLSDRRVILPAMSLISRVRGWLVAATMRYQFDSQPRPVAEIIYEMSGRGGAVTRADALSVPAVMRGRNLLCSIATLPLRQVGPGQRIERSAFLDQINPNVANVVTLAMTVEDLIFESVSWWRVIAYGWDGYPVQAIRVDPAHVSLLPPQGTPSLLPSGLDPRGVVWIDGDPVPGNQVIRFDSPNPPVLLNGARAIRKALLIDKLAAMYADNPRPLDYFQPFDRANEPENKTILQLLADWRNARKRKSTGYVPGWAEYKSVDSPSPADLQLVELTKAASLDLANALGLDPEDLGVSTTSRTYANAIDRRRDRINDVLAPYMKAITDRLSMGDITKRGHYVIFELDDYMKSNPTERWSTNKTAKELGVLSAEAIARREGIPVEDMPDKEPAPAPAPPPPAPTDSEDLDVTQQQQTEAGHRPAYTFSAGLQLVQLPLQTFSVDRESRIIEGVAMPYAQTATKYGMQLRFEKGAFQYGNDPTRVKLLIDHDPKSAVGVGVQFTETPEGFRVKFRVARGPEGDRALSLAEDGVLDGLSVGADWDLQRDSIADPRYKGGVLVRRADLAEVSLTAMPAFSNARLTRVVASLTEGSKMEQCTTCGQMHAPGAACTPAPPAPVAPVAPPAPVVPTTFTADQVQAMFAAAGMQLPTGLGQHAPTAVLPTGPTFVNPTHPPVATVSEGIPYRFNRQGFLTAGAQYDFSTDLVRGFRDGDGEALKRAETFMRGQFITAADVATLNPSRQRPDLYVDQKDFTYPLWESIEKGNLADNTPFILPKFSTSGSLVAAHVENTEPAAGTFTATSQTVTPSAVSGKVEIPREVWDAGGNPQVSGLIWRQMVRGWYEALEASAFTLLDGLASTVITITTAAVDAALEASLTSQLAPLKYIRGGFRMRDFFVQVDLYKALIGAKDTTGRKLFPVVGAANSTGTASELYEKLLVAGLVAKPAWATAATGVVSANSFLYDRADVSGWASAPNRLTFDNIAVAKVTIAIWGYKVLANTDVSGTRKIAYDPA